MNQRNVFAELSISEAPSCHITVVSANGLSDEGAQIAILEVNKKLASMVPFQVQLGNFRMVGNQGGIPAYECRATLPFVHAILCDIYSTHWKPSPGKRCYPELLMHVTVNTPEKLAQIEEIFRASPTRSFEVSRFNVGSRVSEGRQEVPDPLVAMRSPPSPPYVPMQMQIDQRAVCRFYGKDGGCQSGETCAFRHDPILAPQVHSYNPESVYNAPPSAPPASSHALPVSTAPNTWLCGSCNRVNSMTVKECGTGSCTEWRPRVKRAGDWQCCGEMQFSSRNKCRKCGQGKRSRQ